MANWDVGRFLNTMTYFDAVPIFSDLRRWFAGESDDKSTTIGERNLGVILVIGVTSELGRSIVTQLLAHPQHKVRAIVSDADAARSSLPTGIELITGELNANMITDRMMQDVRAIVYCPHDRDSLSDTDLIAIATAAKSYLPEPTKSTIFDFTPARSLSAPNLQTIWGSVDDVVMGGVSESGMRWSGNSAVFSGRVSTDNSGGFASVRTRNFEPTLDLSDYTGIEIRVKGDGQRYKLFIRTEATWDGVGYAYSFDTIANEWTTIEIPFTELVPVFRAKIVNPSMPIDRRQIRAFQLMLSKFEYDKALNPRFTPGLFSLEIESIAAYGGTRLPQLAIVQEPADELSASILAPDALALLDATSLPYSIIRSGSSDLQTIATTTIKALSQPATGQKS